MLVKQAFNFIEIFLLCVQYVIIMHSICIYCSAVPDNVARVVLTCVVMDQINQCAVKWDVRKYAYFYYAHMYILHTCRYICAHINKIMCA